MANLAIIPDDLSGEQVLMCADIMSTGFGGAERANNRIADTVAVFARGTMFPCPGDPTEEFIMRRFQNILYVTRGTEDEGDSLKQALSLARNNATQLHVLIVAPVLPKSLGEYEASYKASLADFVRASITNTQAALKMRPDEVPVRLEVHCADTPAIHIVRRVLRDAHDVLIKQAEATQPRMGFRALDMQLLRQCPCPLWLCRPVTRPGNEICVAVAVDPQSTEPAGWDLALQLLRLSRSLADTCSGEISILQCSLLTIKPNGFVSQVRAY